MLDWPHRVPPRTIAQAIRTMVETHLRALAFFLSRDGIGLILRIAFVSAAGLLVVFVLSAMLIDTSNLRIELFGYEINFLESLAFWVALGSVFVVLTVLWLPIVALATSCFLERIASSAERRYFPDLGPPLPVTFGSAIHSGIRISLLTGSIATLMLLGAPFLGPAAPFIGAGATGYVLGREYHDLVALRRLPPSELSASWQRSRGMHWIAGFIASLAMLVPILNLFAPVYGVAFAAISFHDPYGTGQQAPLRNG